MRLLEVKPDFRFRTLLTSDPTFEEYSPVTYGREILQDRPLLLGWKPLRLFTEHPKRKRSNFARSWGGGFVIDSHVQDALPQFRGTEFELLPLLPYNGETLHVLNVLLAVDCLDHELTKRAIDDKSGTKLSMIEEYHFVAERVPKSILFRLPKRSSLFTACGTGRAEYDLESIVEREGLTGLKFEQVWSDSE